MSKINVNLNNMEKYFLTVDKNGDESAWDIQPLRNEEENYWCWKPNKYDEDDDSSGEWAIGIHIHDILLPKGKIEELIGKKLTWEDEPYIYETQTPDIDFEINVYDDEDDDEEDVFDVICPNCNKTFECGWSDFVIDNDRYYYRCDRCGTLIRQF